MSSKRTRYRAEVMRPAVEDGRGLVLRQLGAVGTVAFKHLLSLEEMETIRRARTVRLRIEWDVEDAARPPPDGAPRPTQVEGDA